LSCCAAAVAARAAQMANETRLRVILRPGLGKGFKMAPHRVYEIRIILL
jgi:hypothetical protein